MAFDIKKRKFIERKAKTYELKSIDRDIIRSLENVEIMVTPYEIGEKINAHPETVKTHLIILNILGYVKIEERGNRTYTKLLPGIKVE